MRSLAGFPGTVHPVHPHADDVLGRRAFPDVAALPAVPDLALVAVPAASAPGVVRACGLAGVAGAVVYAGGFAEAGSDGARLQDALAAAAAETGIRVLGPNTSGFIAPHHGLCASFVGAAAGVPTGPLAIVAQSGGVNLALAFAAQAEGLGVRFGVGLGNAVDVGFADILEHVAADPGVGVVALAIEGAHDGRRLVDAVSRLVERVPVVALKVGRSDVTAFAQSHTGSLTGNWSVTRSALRQAGAVVVDDTTALIDAARALAMTRLPAGERPGVGLVTGQAGPGLLLADALGVAGVALPELPSETQRALEAQIGPLTFRRNPVDTGRPGSSFPDVLRTVAASEAIDLLAVYVLDEPEVVDVADALGAVDARPLVVGTGGPPARVGALRDRLAGEGIPVYPTPERTAAAVSALVADARARHRRRSVPQPPAQGAHAPASAAGDWDEDRAKQLIAAAGIPVPARRVCASHAEAIEAAMEIGFPVVAKLVHPELRHKTELGAVRVGLQDRTTLAVALAELDAVPVPASAVARYLVEAMAPPGPELLVGAVRDPAFGPLVVMGAGGVEAELGEAVAIRLAPIGVAEAATMLDELSFADRYRGFRGGPAVDQAALARTAAAVSSLIAERPDIAELEINPLRVAPDGAVLALDALVVSTAQTPET
jgi:acyl-CoA synthetase (NDP forming)